MSTILILYVYVHMCTHLIHTHTHTHTLAVVHDCHARPHMYATDPLTHILPLTLSTVMQVGVNGRGSGDVMFPVKLLLGFLTKNTHVTYM